jgi:hypothetical protein
VVLELLKAKELLVSKPLPVFIVKVAMFLSSVVGKMTGSP